MRIFSLTLLLSIFIKISFAQFPGGGRPGGQQMNVGQFYGKLLDEQTGKPLEGATVQLIQNKMDTVTKKKRDFTLAFMLTDRKGEFLIDQLPVMGNFRLLISAVGYKLIEQKIAFDLNMGAGRQGDMSGMMNSVVKDLGNIKMQQDSRELQNVTVTASKPLLEMNIDRKVYNVEKDISVAGGTAVDVMKNVPSVNVDIDGNVTLRNSSPQIFVDGRPTTLSLEQIPADQISTVEIITNPSAKYDASGGGSGILNIVMKKNRRTGYNGNVRASIDSRGRPGGGGDINLRQGKVNFFAAAQVHMPKSIGESNATRSDFFGDSVVNLSQISEPGFRGGFGFGRLGLDYFIDNRNTLTISGHFVKRKFSNYDDINIDRNWFDNGILVDKETGNRITDNVSRGKNYGSSVSFKHNFARAGKEWTADASFHVMDNKNEGNFSTRYFDVNNNPKGLNTIERSLTDGDTRFFTVQTDYTDPLTKTSKIEAGLRFSQREFSSLNNNYFRTPGTEFILIPALYINYKYTDKVYAAYATYSQQIKKFSFQTGLRIESSEYDGDFISKSQKFGNEYPFSLFPSVFLTYKLTDKQDFQVNYTRKVNRPNFFQLIPFVDYSDSLNLSVGNPDLVPEFTNLVEIGYSNQFKPGHSVLLSLYGKNTNDLITRYQYRAPHPDIARTDSVLLGTFANANRSYTFGLEITGKNKIMKWWDLTTNINLYQVQIDAGNIPGTEDSRQFSWFGKLNNSFTLPKNFSIQFTADYQAKTLLPAQGGGARGGGGGGGMWGHFGMNQSTAQGYIKPVYGFDISLRKNFLKNNAASLTLQFSDIFRTRLYGSFAESAFFVQDNERRRDPQVLRLNFNYRFGKLDVGLFKRKNIRGEMETMQSLGTGG